MTVSNTAILKAQRGVRNGMVNAGRFSAKTGGPARTDVLRSGERLDYRVRKSVKYQAMSDEYQEQRGTALFSRHVSFKTQGFLGRREAPPLIISEEQRNSEEGVLALLH